MTSRVQGFLAGFVLSGAACLFLACGKTQSPRLPPSSTPSGASRLSEVAESLKRLEELETELRALSVLFECSELSQDQAPIAECKVGLPRPWISFVDLSVRDEKSIERAIDKINQYGRLAILIAAMGELDIREAHRLKARAQVGFEVMTFLERRLGIQKLFPIETAIQQYGGMFFNDVGLLLPDTFLDFRPLNDEEFLNLENLRLSLDEYQMIAFEALAGLDVEKYPVTREAFFWATAIKAAEEFLTRLASPEVRSLHSLTADMSARGLQIGKLAVAGGAEGILAKGSFWFDLKLSGLHQTAFSKEQEQNQIVALRAIKVFLHTSERVLKLVENSAYATDFVAKLNTQRASAAKARDHILFRQTENEVIASLTALEPWLVFRHQSGDKQVNIFSVAPQFLSDAYVRALHKHLLILVERMEFLASMDKSISGLRYITEGDRNLLKAEIERVKEEASKCMR